MGRYKHGQICRRVAAGLSGAGSQPRAQLPSAGWWEWTAYCGSIDGVKLSLSIPEDDVRFIDGKARDGTYPSRSAVVVAAIRTMRHAELTDSYVAAFDEWASGGEAGLWEAAVGDGLSASR